jgi:transcription elongation factor Elf1
MDPFALIQKFMQQLQCPHCGSHLHEEDVTLLGRDKNMHLVRMHCHTCDTSIGTAMVGVESMRPNQVMDATEGNISTFMGSSQEGMSQMEGIPFSMEFNESFSEKMFNKRRKQASHSAFPMPQFVGHHGLTEPRRRYKDPELTPEEKERLSVFAPIGTNDLLDAHHAIQSLDAGWMKLIPPEMRQRCTGSDTESQDA